MNVVITIGTGNSGCGVAHDFLENNTNYDNPFKSKEFRLIDDPDGILSLFHNFYRNYSINNISNAIFRFEKYVHNLTKLKTRVNGKGENIYKKEILTLSKSYIENITTLNYNALPEFMSIQTNYFIRKYFNIKRKLLKTNYNPSSFKMYLPVKEEVFFQQTKIFLSKIIKLHSKKNNDYILLDQAFNMWNFKNVFSYFDKVKVVLITRDPRGIFYSMKSRQSAAYPGHNIKLWVKWYKFIIKKFENYKKNIDAKHKKDILEIKFENFVQNYEKEQIKLLNFVSTKKIHEKFNIKKSKLNAFKAKYKLSNFEESYIKKKLKKYLRW